MQLVTSGKTAVAFTDRGTEITVKYAVVEIANLVASHDINLRVNRAYPATLQPRDRSRLASEDQVNRIAKSLRPVLLGPATLAADGAPVVGPDAVVESGNARTIALMRV